MSRDIGHTRLGLKVGDAAVVAEARAERVPQRRSPGAACPGVGGESRACPELALLSFKLFLSS